MYTRISGMAASCQGQARVRGHEKCCRSHFFGHSAYYSNALSTVNLKKQKLIVK